MSPDEEKLQKLRLNHLVKDFAREVVSGIPLNLMSPWTRLSAPYSFLMDRSLSAFVLKPLDGSAASDTTIYEGVLENITRIYKGADVASRLPSLSGSAGFCVAVEVRPDCRYVLHFDDPEQRDRFYTSLRILRLSVDIARGLPPA